MLNPATNISQNNFNVFTEFLLKQIKLGVNPLVQLRNGMIVPISWYDSEGPDYEHFIYRNDDVDAYLCWNNDGTSITSYRFDIMGLAVE